MSSESTRPDRRIFLGAFGAALFTTKGLFAEELLRPSPRMTEGPFYPDRLPLDQDNDLIIISDSVTPAVGVVTHLTGRVLSPSGEPIKDATIEIWQCDANAVYLHSRDSVPKAKRRDANFQGFGRFVTASNGEYRFRTIKPVPYPGRPAPHIHVKVKRGERELITTQIFVKGEPGNAKDMIFRNLRDPKDRDAVAINFKPVKESKIGEYQATFDVVVGRTPAERRSAG